MQILRPCPYTPDKSEALGAGVGNHPSDDSKVQEGWRTAFQLQKGWGRPGLGPHWEFMASPGPAPTCARWAASSVSRGNRVGTSSFTCHLFTGHLPILEEAGVPITTRPRTLEQGSPRTPHTHLAPALGTPRLCPAAPQLVHGSQVPAGRRPWCRLRDCGVRGQGRGHHCLLLEC